MLNFRQEALVQQESETETVGGQEEEGRTQK